MSALRWDAVHDWAGSLIRLWVTQHHSPRRAILDIGAGWGKYRELLPEYSQIDACEIWEPTVEAEGLRSRYRDVWVGDVYDLVHSAEWSRRRYDLAILGDVLEHMQRSRAQAALKRLYDQCGDVLVVVPYLYEQREEEGNPYQRHLQPDLTPELMAGEYPELRLIAVETRGWRPFKGLYLKRKDGAA